MFFIWQQRSQRQLKMQALQASALKKLAVFRIWGSSNWHLFWFSVAPFLPRLLFALPWILRLFVLDALLNGMIEAWNTQPFYKTSPNTGVHVNWWIPTMITITFLTLSLVYCWWAHSSDIFHLCSRFVYQREG